MKICNDRTGADKKIHLFVALAIAAVVGLLLSPWPFHSAWIAGAIAFGVALAAGIWKEVRDSRQSGNHFCVWDLVADIAGALVGATIAALANYYCFHDIGGNLL